MFCSARNHGRALLHPVRPSACLKATATTITRLSQVTQTRHAATTRKTGSKKHYFEPTNPLAHKLKATGVWRQVAEKSDVVQKRRKRGERAPAKVAGDKSRINITSEPLVDDIIKYLGHSLDRHKGCDLISLYPGAGLWSQALHDRLQPRSHLLLEPDEALYTPFLQPLLKRDGVRLIPKSGIIWNDLDKVLTPEYLPHQKEIPRDHNIPTPRNDTLLVSVNLAMYPKKKYQLFESISKLVVYQLISSMRTSTLFQKYGQVRMLVWIPADERTTTLPRTLHHRRRLSIEAELFSETVGEVCGPDGVFTEDADGYSEQPDQAANSNRRWGQLDLESVRLALCRMRDNGIVTPKGRETRLMQFFRNEGYDLDTPIKPTEFIVTIDKKAQKQYDELLAAHTKSPFDIKSDEYKRLKMLKNYLLWRDKNEHKSFEKFVAYHHVLQAYVAAGRATSPTEREELLQKAKEMEAALDKDWEKTPGYLQTIILLGRDQARMLFHQPPEMGPVLAWDRRPYEPLTVTPYDFFPNIPCTLLDIQPKSIPVSLRAIGPGTNNSGGIFDLLLGVLLQRPVQPLAGQLDILWPGANDEIVPQLKALTDPEMGGSPMTGFGAMSCRALNQYQMMELLERYVEWPFRPSYADLVGRLSEERYGEEESAADEDHVSGSHASPESL